MKYIVTEQEDGTEEIFLFPDAVHHDCFAEMLPYIKDQTGGNWKRVDRRPISAGFVSSDNKCFGNSETLGLKASEHHDTALLRKQFAAR